MLESLLIKLQAWPANLLKKGLRHRCFLVNLPLPDFTIFLKLYYVQSLVGCSCGYNHPPYLKKVMFFILFEANLLKS